MYSSSSFRAISGLVSSQLVGLCNQKSENFIGESVGIAHKTRFWRPIENSNSRAVFENGFSNKKEIKMLPNPILKYQQKTTVFFGPVSEQFISFYYQEEQNSYLFSQCIQLKTLKHCFILLKNKLKLWMDCRMPWWWVLKLRIRFPSSAISLSIVQNTRRTTRSS